MIAPPVPKWSSPSSNQNVRMATLSSPRRGRRRPSRPRRSTRRGRPVRARGCARCAASFGAPVTEPGGNVASITSGQPQPGRSRPATVDTRWHRPGCASTAHSAGTCDRAELAHAAEIVADEVDDHHVLGAVLRQEAVGGRGRALDRRRRHDVAVAAQEQLGRRRRDVHAVRREAARPPRTARGCPRPARRRARRRRRRGGKGADSRRVRFTWYTSPGADRPIGCASTPRAEPAAVEARGPRARRRRPATAGPATASPADRARSGRRPARPSNGQHDRPGARGVERGEVGRDVDETGEQAAADDGERASPSSRSVGSRRTVTLDAVRTVRRARGVPRRRAGLRRGRDRAARRAVGPRPRVSRPTSCCGWASSGLFGLPFPEEYGGGGADLTTLCIAIEELARVDHSMAITLEAGVGLGANPIHRFGTEEQKQKWLPDLCAGRALGAFGLTEPEAGSDAGGTRTEGRARRGDGRVGDRRREGVHHQLRHADHVDHHGHGPHRPGRDHRDRRARGHAGSHRAAAVPEDGLARVRHARPDVRRLPGAGRATSSASAAAASRSSSPSSTRDASRSPRSRVGAIEACLELSTQYAKDRNAFGRPIGANQGVAFKCADLAVMAASARLLVVRGGVAARHGPAVPKRSARSRSSTRPRRP